MLAITTVYAAGVADDWPPKPIRIDRGVSGHIHPAAYLTKKGTVLVAYCRSDYKDMRLTRSADGGRTWSEPVAFAPTAKVSINLSSLTTLADGRILHAWNTWYHPEKGEKSRFVQYSISTDERRHVG